MNFSRKTFLEGLGLGFAASAAAPSAWAEGDQPVFRAGLLTDTHVLHTAASCRIVAKAMEFFRREHADVVCHLGDLADVFSPSGFDAYRQVIDRTFGDRVPLMLYAFGGHDRNGYQLRPGETDRNEAGWKVMRERLKIAHDRYDTVEFRGYVFVIISEYFEEAKAAQMIEDAVLRHPSKPVFVLEHEPAYDTTYDSVAWGNKAIRRICDRYPQVIHLSGHVHGSHRNELNIWQDGFTEINAGCLQSWRGEAANTSRHETSLREEGVLLMDVYENRVVVRRFSLVTGEEHRPFEPWEFPLPFEAKSAPYRAEERQKTSRPPTWPNRAVVRAARVEEPGFRGVRVDFPAAAHNDGTYRYQVVIRDAAGKTVTVKETLGEFWKVPTFAQARQMSVDFDEGYFLPERSYEFSVTPTDFYGNAGEALRTTVRLPWYRAQLRKVYAAADAMKVLTFSTHSWGSHVKPVAVDADGFATVKSAMFRADLPAEALPAADPKGTRYVLDFAFEDRHDSRCSWRVDLEDAKTGRPLPDGDHQLADSPVGEVRYRVRFTKPEDGPLALRIGFSYGDVGGRVRISSLRIDAKNQK